MSSDRAQLSQQARAALARGDIASAHAIARNLLASSPYYADGHYLAARVAMAQRQPKAALLAYRECLTLDKARIDVVVELSDLLLRSGEHAESYALLSASKEALLATSGAAFAAAGIYSRLGMHQEALVFYKKANELQPNVPSVEAGLAACATKNGEIPLAQELYQKLLAADPGNQRNHYELSRLRRASSRQHVDAMLAQLKLADQKAGQRQANHVFMHFAIAKELEDLEDWQSSFEHYAKGAEMAAIACAAGGYSVAQDVAALEECQKVFDRDWFTQESAALASTDSALTSTDLALAPTGKVPVFVVGLPRTGTTLVERILASHPEIGTADETFFMQAAVAKLSNTLGQPLQSTIAASRHVGSVDLNREYRRSVEYRLSEEPYFVDKYPFNFHYLGLIARAMPHAKIVLLERDPMDACVAMFKQPYFNYSFRLEDLADYYLAYRRLINHWHTVIPNIHVIKYEDLIADTNAEIDRLLKFVGVEVDPICYRFFETSGASATASSVQIREKVHSRSVGKWRNWHNQLKILSKRLESH